MWHLVRRIETFNLFPWKLGFLYLYIHCRDQRLFSTPLNCDLYSTWNCFVSGVSMSWCSITLAMKRGWSKRLHFSYFFVVEFSFSVSRWSIWFIFDVLVVVFSTTRRDIKVAKLLLRVLLLVGGEVKETYQKSNHSNINWSRDNSGIRATIKRFQPFVITSYYVSLSLSWVNFKIMSRLIKTPKYSGNQCEVTLLVSI